MHQNTKDPLLSSRPPFPPKSRQYVLIWKGCPTADHRKLQTSTEGTATQVIQKFGGKNFKPRQVRNVNQCKSIFLVFFSGKISKQTQNMLGSLLTPYTFLAPAFAANMERIPVPLPTSRTILSLKTCLL